MKANLIELKKTKLYYRIWVQTKKYITQKLIRQKSILILYFI